MLVSNPLGLWWVAVTCTVAGIMTVVGALRGVSAHRVPRMMLAISVIAIAISYWWDIAGSSGISGAEMRRGAGYILWPSLLWTAWSGISYSTRRSTIVNKVLGEDK